MAESRTQKSLRNAKVALFFSVLTFALGFFSRKILLEALGAEVLGLYTTAFNLCGFLNLAELGITSAVAFSLYKPLFDNDREAITEIVSIQGWLFRYVGIAMSVGALLLMSLFPVFFNEEKTNLPLWYSYATFGVIFISQVLGYFFCYQQTLLSADQQEYKVTFCLQGGRALKILLQIIGIGFCGMGYEYWLVVEMMCGLLTLVCLWLAIRHQYPWLKADIEKGKNLKSKYSDIISKVKQMMVHKMCFTVIDRVTPVMIYGLISLSMVAIYGNYMMIVTNIGGLIWTCSKSMTASLGNLVVENNRQKIEEYFRSFISFKIWLMSIICFCIYHLATPFMILWIGPEYLFSNQVLAMIVFYAFVDYLCNTEPFIDAFGLFQDTWASVVKLIINVGLSLTLGLIFGIEGILAGVIISIILILGIWKPYLLYTQGFKCSPLKLVIEVASSFVMIAISWIVSDYLLKHINNNISSWSEFVLVGLLVLLISACINTVLFYICNNSFRLMVHRIVSNSITKRN